MQPGPAHLPSCALAALLSSGRAGWVKGWMAIAWKGRHQVGTARRTCRPLLALLVALWPRVLVGNDL